MLIKVIEENGVYGILSQNYAFIPFIDQTYDFEAFKFVEASNTSVIAAEMVYGCNVIFNGKVKKWTKELSTSVMDRDTVAVLDRVVVLSGNYKKKVSNERTPKLWFAKLLEHFYMLEISYFLFTMVLASYSTIASYNKYILTLPFLMGCLYMMVRYIDIIGWKYRIYNEKITLSAIPVFIAYACLSSYFYILFWTILFLFYTGLKLYCIRNKYWSEYAKLIKFKK